MERWLKEQLAYAAKYFVPSLLQYPFIAKDSDEVRKFREKNGGMIHGVCRPDEDFALLKDAGFGWVRTGISLPPEDDAEWEDVARLRRYRDNGLKVMAITPSVGFYLRRGIDPRTPGGEERVRTLAREMIARLGDVISGVQICNEIGIPRFGHPLTMDEAARFLGVQAEEMAPLKGDVIVGYNSVGPSVDQHYKMRPWFPCLDYVGMDMYIGCFFPVLTQLGVFEVLLKYLWAFTRKPVMLMEFGYLAGGAPKTREEKRAILRGYGAESEKDARRNIREFVARFNGTARQYVERCASGGWGDYVFSREFRQHLYRELPANVRVRGCPHTPEGQAEFYRRLLPRLERLPFLGGMFIYTHRDDPRCCICGQADCPMETRWGLCTHEGEPRAGYYAVKEMWGGHHENC